MPKWLDQICDIPTNLNCKHLPHIFQREYQTTLTSASKFTETGWLEAVVKFIKEDLDRLERDMPTGSSDPAVWNSFCSAILHLFRYWIKQMGHGVRTGAHQRDGQLTTRSSFDTISLLLTLIRLRYDHVDDLLATKQYHPKKTNVKLVEDMLKALPFFIPLSRYRLFLMFSLEHCLVLVI